MSITKNVIGKFEKRKSAFRLAEIYDSLRSQCGDDEKNSVEYRTEILVFSLTAEYPNSASALGEYFGPLIEFTNGDIYPSKEMFTSEIFDFWKHRAEKSRNPFMKARYSDALWDFGYTFNNEKRDYKQAQTAIENYTSSIQIMNAKVVDFECVKIFRRAIQLSKSINDVEQLSHLTTLLLDTYKKPIKDALAGVWSGLFELFLENRTAYTENETRIFVEKIEQRIDEMLRDVFKNAHSIETGIECLINYQKFFPKHECGEIISKYRKAIEEIVDMNPIQRIHYLENILRYYKDIGMSKEAVELYSSIVAEGQKQKGNLQEIKFKQKFSKELVDKISSEFKDIKSISEVFLRLLQIVLSQKSDVEKETEELYKQYPLSFIISKNIIDERGVTMFRFGSFESDKESHIMYQYTQNISIKAIFVEMAFMGLLENNDFTAEKVIAYLATSPVLEVEKQNMTEQAVRSFFNKDYITFITLSLILIESLVRSAILKNDGQIIRENNKNGYDYFLLHEMLCSEFIKNILPEEIIYFLRVVLVEKRGLNLRNSILHGLRSDNVYNVQNARLILIVLLLFGQFRENEG